MIDINTISLDSLPTLESDDLEYKSSMTQEKALPGKIQKAASAFWNSGGGVLIVGVDDNGVVDDGISCAVGHQAITDWVPQIIAGVIPQGTHAVRIFPDSDHPKIKAGKCVLAIAFAASDEIPHQAADKHYYIRAGAHSSPAPHFIVDALYAKRNFRKPQLVHNAILNEYSSSSDYLHVEVIAVTDGVALDVEIDFSPRRDVGALSLPIVVPVIDREHSFAFRFEIPHQPVFMSDIVISYRDFAHAQYHYRKTLDVSKCLSPEVRDAGGLEKVANAAVEIKRVLERILSSMR